MNLAVIPFTQWLFSIIEYAAFVGLGVWFIWSQPKRIEKRFAEGAISGDVATREKKKARWLGAVGIACFLALLIMQLFAEHS